MLRLADCTRPFLPAAVLALLLAPHAAGQSFNVDCVSNSNAPIPSDAHGAAAGQTGHWNAVQVTESIEDLGGNPTPVWLQVPGNQPGNGDDVCTSGDDEALLDDAHVPQSASYRFSGLIPGAYRIYTYAMDADDATTLTDVGVTGSPDAAQTIGGDFCGGYVLGATHALHHITTTDGTIFVTVSGNTSNFSIICGFQVVCETCSTGTPLCFGDGSGSQCPCGNSGSPTAGCANGTGAGAELSGTGLPNVTNDSVVLHIADAAPNQPGLYFQGNNFINSGDGVLFGDGLRCCGAGVVRLEVTVSDGGGNASTSVPVAAEGGVSSGDAKCYQYWYRDPAGTPCGTSFNLSNAYRIDWL